MCELIGGAGSPPIEHGLQQVCVFLLIWCRLSSRDQKMHIHIMHKQTKIPKWFITLSGCRPSLIILWERNIQVNYWHDRYILVCAYILCWIQWDAVLHEYSLWWQPTQLTTSPLHGRSLKWATPGRCRKLFVFLTWLNEFVPTISKSQVGGYADASFCLGGDEHMLLLFFVHWLVSMFVCFNFFTYASFGPTQASWWRAVHVCRSRHKTTHIAALLSTQITPVS